MGIREVSCSACQKSVSPEHEIYDIDWTPINFVAGEIEIKSEIRKGEAKQKLKHTNGLVCGCDLFLGEFLAENKTWKFLKN